MATFLPEIKSRTRSYGNPIQLEVRSSGGAPWQSATRNRGSISETIVSQCHTGLWPPPLDSDKDVGGEMRLNRTWSYYSGTQEVNWPARNVRGELSVGSLIGYTPGSSPAAAASLGALNAFGTSAIAAVLPTNPNASLATAIGELKKDGLPSLPGSTMRDQVALSRRAGSEYLNVEFGWLPLVRDLQSFARSVQNARVLIDQYRRDSGRKIRRRYTAPPIVSHSITSGTAQIDAPVASVPNARMSRSDQTSFWFSGAFKYHVPVADDLYGRLRKWESELNFLFGTRITPELIWNLSPWSWAIDWFTNIGDVIHNISQLGSDGLVMQYGYAMRHARVEENLWCLAYRNHSTQGTPEYANLTRSFGSEWKQRVRANPYGFGIDDGDLSARQLAILAALGLSRGERTR